MHGLGIVSMTEVLPERGRICFAHSCSLLSVAVIEHTEQKHFEEERVYLAYTQDHSLSLREVRAGTQEGVEAGNSEESHSLAYPLWLAQLLS